MYIRRDAGGNFSELFDLVSIKLFCNLKFEHDIDIDTYTIDNNYSNNDLHLCYFTKICLHTYVCYIRQKVCDIEKTSKERTYNFF